MLAITITLLICQHMSTSSSTRLPLEVYELPPAATATSATTITTEHDMKHKNLEYSTINATATDAAIIAVANRSNDEDFRIFNTNEQIQQIEHRRSRQMLDIIEQQQQQQAQKHRFNHDALNNIQKQQQHHQDVITIKRHGYTKDVRILYQVGDSEDDLPICAPNAVCSKIDHYETPWIERQCRCPETNRMPISHVIIHQHHHHNNHDHDLQQQQQHNIHTEKYRNYYEKEKILQHKRLLVGDFNDKKFESLHLKKIMQKLGAVYADDLHLQPSDYLANEDNDALPSMEDMAVVEEVSDNEFPHGPRKNYYATTTTTMNTAHMRHSSGHSSHNRVKETTPMTFIGGCPSELGIEDGHTIADKTRHYKLCQPVHKLPVCKHFRDYTWTLTTSAELNVTEQIVHCRCPKSSVTYLTKREPAAAGTSGYNYLFACSPLTRIRCQRKQPCKLFTVRKRQEFLDEVNINSLCQCPKGHRCPNHHTQSGVISGESFLEDNIQTYSGYCMTND